MPATKQSFNSIRGGPATTTGAARATGDLVAVGEHSRALSEAHTAVAARAAIASCGAAADGAIQGGSGSSGVAGHRGAVAIVSISVLALKLRVVPLAASLVMSRVPVLNWIAAVSFYGGSLPSVGSHT